MITSLHVQALWSSLLFPVEDVLLGLLEVLLGHLHPPLPQGQETGLSADGLYVGTREVILNIKVVKILPF